MQTFVTVIHVITCVLLVLVVLIQSGKGAEISTSFGGSSQTVFGSSGGANFFTRFTSGAAAVFMVTSLTLTLLGGQSKKSLFEGSMATGAAAVPATTQAPTQSASGSIPAAGVSSSQEKKSSESAPAQTH
jgi:preprotein translocase subunit SecG